MRSPDPRSLAALAVVLLLAPPAAAEDTPPTAGAVGATDVEVRRLGSLVFEDVPPIPEAVRERVDQYAEIRTARFLDWLPDGGVLVATRFGETNQIHRVAVPGGARRQLTFFDEPVAGASVSPDPALDGFVFGRDTGGGEWFQLYWLDAATARARLLTDGGETQNGGVVWSHRGDRFAYSTTRRNGRDHDVHLLDPKTGASTPIVEAEGAWSPVSWSPDDATLLVARYVSAAETHLHVVDVATGARREVLADAQPTAFGGAVLGDGVLYFSADFDLPGRPTEWKRLRRLDLATGEVAELRPDLDWDVGSLELSPDGRRLAYVVNEAGSERLHVMDTATGAALDLPGLPPAVLGAPRFDRTGRRLGLTVETSTSPDDAWSLDLETRTWTRWTESETGGLDPSTFVDPELVRYPTFDTVDGAPRTIPAFYYRPPGPGPFPVVIDVHGGPEGQERPDFNPTIQFWLAEQGIAVLAPNVRGSSGFGKTYLGLDDAERREDSVKDLGALLDWIATRPELDASRVGVYGGSYGGYMVLAALVHYGDRLRAGVDVVGISNFVTFLENTEDYRRDLRRVEYGDERDPEMRALLERISPANRAEAIRSPLFVVQGANDPRVPRSEAEQIVREVRANGRDVWYLLAEDEGHGFRRKSNREMLTAAVTLFWDEFLLADDSDGDAPAR